MPSLSALLLSSCLLLMLISSSFTPSTAEGWRGVGFFKAPAPSLPAINIAKMMPPTYFHNIHIPSTIQKTYDFKSILKINPLSTPRIGVVSQRPGTVVLDPYAALLLRSNSFKEYRGSDYEHRGNAIASLVSDGANATDYFQALDKATDKCHASVVDVLASKGVVLTSKSKSTKDSKLTIGGKVPMESATTRTFRDDVYDVVDCALMTGMTCKDLLDAARDGDNIDTFDVSGSFIKTCKDKAEYAPLDVVVAMVPVDA